MKKVKFILKILGEFLFVASIFFMYWLAMVIYYG